MMGYVELIQLYSLVAVLTVVVAISTLQWRLQSGRIRLIRIWLPYFVGCIFAVGVAASTLLSCFPTATQEESVKKECEDEKITECIKKQGEREEGPFWNSWSVDESTDERVADLRAGETYRIYFDLSAYNYSDREAIARTAGVSSDFKLEIDKIKSSPLTLYALPVVSGSLELMPESRGTKTFEIDLNRLKNPPKRWQKDRDFHSFVKHVSALSGEPFRVKGLADGGCAALALSIWDRKLERPIDHLVSYFRVIPQSGVVPKCGQAWEDKPLTSGLLTLLDAPDQQRNKAGLHIFELRMGAQQKAASIAVYIAQGEPPRSWPISETLTQFVNSPAGLRGVVKNARTARTYDFRRVSKALCEAIFTSSK